MLDLIRDWYNRNFSDPQAVILAFLLVVVFGLVWLIGDVLAPVLVALICAYLLEGVVAKMQQRKVPRTLASALVLLIFVATMVIVLFGLVPVLSQQVSSIVKEVPSMIAAGQDRLLLLPQKYPEVFTNEQVDVLIRTIRNELAQVTQNVLSFSLARLGTFVAILVYAVLVPLMVFFALKDKDKLLQWGSKFIPHGSELTFKVWKEVDQKIADYIRGKFAEIVIVWLVTYLVFYLMDLNYSLLLSFLVGMSVIVPYVGAIAVTVPIALIGFFQWGLTAKFGYLLLTYQIIQILDGNVLVPLLFSEAVNLHPLAIIISVLFFGGLLGLWGVFFAIPLAALVQAVLNAWPGPKQRRSDESRQRANVA